MPRDTHTHQGPDRGCRAILERATALGILILLANGSSGQVDVREGRSSPRATEASASAADDAVAPSGGVPAPSRRGLPVPPGTRAAPHRSGPAWEPLGPAPIRFGQVENVVPDDEVAGAIHALAAHPTDPDLLYAASVNGGVWRTRDATALRPHWEPLTDDLPSLSITALEMDPGDPAVLLAGVGHLSSMFFGGPLVGLYLTRDGGRSWEVLDDPLLQGRSMTSVAVSGDLLLAGASSLYESLFVESPRPGALLRSADGGRTWKQVSGSGIPVGDVLDIVGDPGAPGRYYATVATRGVFRSDDFGLTWLDTSVDDADLRSQISDPGNNNAEMAVAPTTGRLYVNVIVDGLPTYIGFTDDLGASWVGMDLPGTLDGGRGIVVDATNTAPIVVTTERPHGMTTGDFVQIGGVRGNTEANGLHQIRVRNMRRFNLMGKRGNGGYQGGGVWQEVSGLGPRPKPGGQGVIHASIRVDPLDADVIYVGGDRQELPEIPNSIGATDFSGRLFRGNATIPAAGIAPSPQWEHMTHVPTADTPGGGTLSSSAPHADSREMVVTADGELIQSDDGGVFRRTRPRDNRGDWLSMAGDLQVTEFHDVAYDSLSNVVFAGAQDNGVAVQAHPRTRVFLQFQGGDGSKVEVDDWSTPGRSFRYHGGQVLIGFQRTTWNARNQLLDVHEPALRVVEGNAFVPNAYTAFALNAVDPRRLVFVGATGVFESLDTGETLRQVVVGGFETRLFQDCVAAGGMRSGVAEPDALYAGYLDDLYVRRGAGRPAQVVTPRPGLRPWDVVMDPDDWQHAYLAADRVADATPTVWCTSDAGRSWTDVTGNLIRLGGNIVRTIQYVPGRERDLIVLGSVAGAFVAFEDLPGVWAPLGSGLPNTRILGLDYDRADDVLVTASTGRGCWKLSGASRAARRLQRLEVTTLDLDLAGPAGAHSLRVEGHVALAAGSLLNLAREDVLIVLDDFVEALPLSAFRRSVGGLRYTAPGPGLTELVLSRRGAFRLTAMELDLSALETRSSALFSLQLGNDFDGIVLALDNSRE